MRMSHFRIVTKCHSLYNIPIKCKIGFTRTMKGSVRTQIFPSFACNLSEKCLGIFSHCEMYIRLDILPLSSTEKVASDLGLKCLPSPYTCLNSTLATFLKGFILGHRKGNGSFAIFLFINNAL